MFDYWTYIIAGYGALALVMIALFILVVNSPFET